MARKGGQAAWPHIARQKPQPQCIAQELAIATQIRPNTDNTHNADQYFRVQPGICPAPALKPSFIYWILMDLKRSPSISWL